MSADLLSQIAAAVACGIIIARCEPALNRMQAGSSPVLLMVAFWCLLVAALGGITLILIGAVPPWPATVGALGVALLLMCERRVRYLTRTPKPHDAS